MEKFECLEFQKQESAEAVFHSAGVLRVTHGQGSLAWSEKAPNAIASPAIGRKGRASVLTLWRAACGICLASFGKLTGGSRHTDAWRPREQRRNWPPAAGVPEKLKYHRLTPGGARDYALLKRYRLPSLTGKLHQVQRSCSTPLKDFRDPQNL